MDLTLLVNESTEIEIINKTSSIASMLANLTTPTQEAIYAKEIDLAVTIISTLNKYVHIVSFYLLHHYWLYFEVLQQVRC